jgi:hypothetical protein
MALLGDWGINFRGLLVADTGIDHAPVALPASPVANKAALETADGMVPAPW